MSSFALTIAGFSAIFYKIKITFKLAHREAGKVDKNEEDTRYNITQPQKERLGFYFTENTPANPIWLGVYITYDRKS